MASTQPEDIPADSDNNEREATELDDYDGDRTVSDCSTRSSEYGARSAHSVSTQSYTQSWKRSMTLFWKRQVSATVPHECCRDHFGMSIPLRSWNRRLLSLQGISSIRELPRSIMRYWHADPIPCYQQAPLRDCPFVHSLTVLFFSLGADFPWLSENIIRSFNGRCHNSSAFQTCAQCKP